MRTRHRLLALLLATGAVLIAVLLLRPGARATTLTAPLTEDQYGRACVQVFVNGRGPMDFVVDTAAAMSCVSPSTARKLHLPAIPGVKVDLQGTSGTQPGRMYLARSFRSGVFARILTPLAGLASSSAVKDGALGMNAFAGRRIELDLRRKRLLVGPSGPIPTGFRALPARLQGTDAIVEVFVDGIRARAIVDTGARRTIANPMLRERLGFAPDDPRLSPAEPSHGATEQSLAASSASLKVISLAGISLESPTVTFSDLTVFRRRGLSDSPSLLLGMDVLGRLSAVAIDYPRSEVQVRR